MRRTVLIAVSLSAVALPPVAQAHVTLQPTEAPAGEFVRLNVRVPNERDRADTTKVDVQLPDGLYFVSYEPSEGWAIRVVREKLARPVPSPFDPRERLSEQVSRVVITNRDRRVAIRPGQFRDFGLSLRTPNRPGRTLSFKALQTYSNGEVVRWIGPPDAEEPAARVKLVAANPQPTEEDDEDASMGMGIAALGIGGLGLVAGIAGLRAARRRPAGP